jgi:hypothetical protein
MSVQLKTLEETKTHATLALGGRLDASGAWEIERETRDYFVGTRHLLIDISGVEFSARPEFACSCGSLRSFCERKGSWCYLELSLRSRRPYR